MHRRRVLLLSYPTTSVLRRRAVLIDDGCLRLPVVQLQPSPPLTPSQSAPTGAVTGPVVPVVFVFPDHHSSEPLSPSHAAENHCCSGYSSSPTTPTASTDRLPLLGL
ncbi:hypothetical protein L1987_17850 [Smallanthus sonchifolius]|uniref:Uncharacterized protein n=1 Tax=Smallanthus sonchifolius TaxID=185202 RepID=A0ACB9IYM5_9ASTR|nr:hypothetical protein L1987_17850 [Smallanthus sonchifolius]